VFALSNAVFVVFLHESSGAVGVKDRFRSMDRLTAKRPEVPRAERDGRGFHPRRAYTMKGTWKVVTGVVIAATWLAVGGVARAQEQKAPAPKPRAPEATAHVKSAARFELPRAVRTAFENAYPEAVIKNASEEMEKGERLYEIESMDGTAARDLIYRADGTLVETEEGMRLADAPRAVRDSLVHEHPKAKVVKIEKLTRGNTVLYEIHAHYGGKTHELTYDPSGMRRKTSGEEAEVKAGRHSGKRSHRRPTTGPAGTSGR
jgi:hypothetical protein